MELIDTHAHIYLPQFKEDINQVIDRAAANGISRILLPAIDNETHRDMLHTEETFSLCKSMMGLHPCSVKENWEDELIVVNNWLQKRKFIAVGEIGLDFYWDTSFQEQQYQAFHYQIELALQYKIPIVIHSRNATRECIDVVKQYPLIKGVFHCFSGSLEEAEEAIVCGFKLGIGGVVTFKNGGLDKVIPSIGLDHLVLETDAPYLTPVPFRGKRNECSYLLYITETVAGLVNKPLEEVAAVTTANAKSLFGLQ